MKLDNDTRREIVQHAVRCYPRESCGLIFERDGALRYQSIPNVAAEPERSFELHPQREFGAVEYAERMGERLVGVAHSHPNGRGEPSARDLDGTAPGLINVIVGYEWDEAHWSAGPVEVRVYAEHYAEEIDQ